MNNRAYYESEYNECCGDLNCKCHSDEESEADILEEVLEEQFNNI